MNQTTQREHILSEASHLWPGAGLDDVALDRIEREYPALYCLIELRATGRLPADRNATDRFLRGLPEKLFNHALTLALAFFRSGARGVEETDLPPELCGLATLLLASEGGRSRYFGDSEELVLALERLARLLLLEEQRRAGCFTFVCRYSLQSKVDDYNPPRIYAIDRRTEH